jgi:hypothetical protein
MRSNRVEELVTGDISEIKRQRQAQEEIDNFLKAMSSYPERFAVDPSLSFEEHLFTITAQNQQLHLA